MMPMLMPISQIAPAAFTDIKSFNEVCAAVGKINMCCLLPIVSYFPLVSRRTSNPIG